MKYLVFLFFLTSLHAEQANEQKSEQQTIPRLLSIDDKVKTEDTQKILPRLLQEPKKEVESKTLVPENQVTEQIKVLDKVETSVSKVEQPNLVEQVSNPKKVQIKEEIAVKQIETTQELKVVEQVVDYVEIPKKVVEQKKIEQKPQVIKQASLVVKKPKLQTPKQHDIETIESVQSVKSYRNNFKTYENDLTRQQMLRRAKYLKKKYATAMTKLENWELEKEQKKKNFFRRYSREDTSFGSDNSYGKKRADRRKREFFRSLAVQEKHIQDRVEDTMAKLADIKAEFLYKFAVPLTESEMSGGTPPSIENKTKRVEMLQEYINENSAWEKCRQKVSDFDRVNRVANSIETLFPEVNLTSQAIAEKMQKNKQEMNSHASRFNSIETDYRSQYGVSISSTQRAKSILESINR